MQKWVLDAVPAPVPVSNITVMGLSISTLLFTRFMYQPSVNFNNIVQFYKYQSETFSLDNEYNSDLFMFEEENLVILSNPSDLIVDIDN